MNIAIIGMDEYGKHVSDTIKEHSNNCNHIIGFLNCDMKAQTNKFEGRPVLSIEALKIQFHKKIDTILIAVTTNHLLSLVLELLHEQGFEEAFLVPLYFLEMKKNFINEEFNFSDDIIKLNLKNPYLAHLETHIVDDCNLNCKACNNFSPFFQKNSVASAVAYREDICQLQHKFEGVLRIFLLGGEPLLSPLTLIDFLNISRMAFPQAEIRVITNAILLDKMPEELFETMRSTRACFQISLYPPMFSKKEKIEEMLIQKAIRYIISAQVTQFVKRLTNHPLEDPITSERSCGSAGCTYLRDGKISKCPDAILVKEFDSKFGTNFESKESIDLYDESITGFNILKRINHPIDMCRYCTNRVEMIDWETASRELKKEDWLTDDLHSYNRKMEVEIEELQEKLIYRDEKIKNCEKTIIDIQARNNDVEKRNNDVEKRNNDLEKRNNDLEKRNNDLEKRNSDVEKRNNDVEKRNNDLKKRNNDVEKRNNDLEKRNNDVESYNMELEGELNRLQIEIIYRDEQIKKQDQIVRTIQTQNQAIESRNNAVEHYNLTLEEEIKRLQTEINYRDELLQEQHEKMGEFEAKNMLLETRLGEIYNSLSWKFVRIFKKK